MSFTDVEVTIEESPLKRRVLGFYLLDLSLVLDFDTEEERASKRHKWRRVRFWSRLQTSKSDMPRRDVPQTAIDTALADVRSRITYEQ